VFNLTRILDLSEFQQEFYTSVVDVMLHTRVTNVVPLPNRALTTENEADRPIISSLKGVGVNMAMLPREMLYHLQDGVTIKLRAWKSHALQGMTKQRINIEQLGLQHNEEVE